MRFVLFFLLVLLTNPVNQSTWKIIVKLSQDREQSKRLRKAGLSGDQFCPWPSEAWQVFRTIILSDVLQAPAQLQVVPT